MIDPLHLITLRGDRDAAKQIDGIGKANAHAERMLQDGKITADEKLEFEAQLLTEMMKQLPMEAYAEMRKDGRWEKLESLTSHDGTRSGWDVTRQRHGLVQRVMRDALSEMWEDGVMDDDTFKSNSQRLGLPDDLQREVTDKDENSAIDTYILNKFGDTEYRQYRDELKKTAEPPKSEEDSLEVPADYAKEFQARHNEPAEASTSQADVEAAPAEEPRAV